MTRKLLAATGRRFAASLSIALSLLILAPIATMAMFGPREVGLFAASVIGIGSPVQGGINGDCLIVTGGNLGQKTCPSFGSTLSLTDYLTATQVTASTTSTATNGTTANGNSTLHFAAVPSWTANGAQIVDLTAPTVIPRGTTVSSSTGTTIVMSANATGAGVGSGDLIMILPDMTTQIQSWLTAMPALGAELVVPPGYLYSASCNFTITAPFLMQGGGSSGLDLTQNGSVIGCGTDAVPLFTINSAVGYFEHISFWNMHAGTPTVGSSAIVVTNANAAGTATNNTTAAGNAVLHFAAVPAWAANGATVVDLTAPSVIPQNPATTVSSFTGTTVNMSANATGAGVGNGDLIAIIPNGNPNQRIDYSDVSSNGFYDAFDIRVGSSWVADNLQVWNFAHDGIHVRNIVIADAGDAVINNSYFYGLTGATGVEYTSSGGLVIGDTKIIPNSGQGSLANGILENFLGASTQFFVNHVSIESAVNPINITNGVLGTLISNSYLKSDNTGGTGNAAITIAAGTSQGAITANTFKTTGTGAGISGISCTNCINMVVGLNQFSDFVGGEVSFIGTQTGSYALSQELIFGSALSTNPGLFGTTTGGKGNGPLITAEVGDKSANASVEARAVSTNPSGGAFGVDADFQQLYLGQLNGGQMYFDNGGTNFGAFANFTNDTWRFGASTTIGGALINPSFELNDSGGSGVSGTARIYKDVRVTKTTNYAIAADGSTSDGGKQFDNLGAGGEVDFTLPTAVVGMHYTFCVAAAQVEKIIAGASTTINVGGSVSTSAGNFTSSQIGACVTLEAYDTTHWIALSDTGSGGSTGAGGWTLH